jgi:hypothetical protein
MKLIATATQTQTRAGGYCIYDYLSGRRPRRRSNVAFSTKEKLSKGMPGPCCARSIRPECLRTMTVGSGVAFSKQL